MVKQIIIPEVPNYLKRPLEEGIDMGLKFVFEKYGKEVFSDCVLMITPNARGGKYYCNAMVPHPKFGYTPVATVPCRAYLYLYERKRLGQYRQGLCVGYEIGIATCVIHELTHHTQFKRRTKWSESETTANEIEFIRKHSPHWYNLLMIEEPKNNKRMERKKFSNQVSPKRKRILELYGKVKQLNQVITKAEKSRLYTLRWEGKVETLHSIQRVVNQYNEELQSLQQ